MPVFPPKVHSEDLGDFPESSFLKIMQHDPVVERRIRSGELPMALLRELYRKFGGTPRFLLQIREAIKEMDAKSLKAELARVELPAGTEPSKLQKLQDKYFGDIFAERLYGYLGPESQKALCRSAVYGVPVTLEGLAAASGETPDNVRAFARSWQDRAFVYQETGRSDAPLWFVYGLLRGWLLSRLSPVDRKDAHKLAGDFLVEMDRQDRESELGLSWVDCLMEARYQYLQAEELELARGVTDRLSGFLVQNGLYDGARQLNAELLNYEGHPSTMSWIARTFVDQGEYDSARIWYQHCIDASGSNQKEVGVALQGIATIDLRKGDYNAARENFGKSMKIRQQIGDMAGEASIWHALATIDLKRSEYKVARENFEKAMKIRQQIGDHLGEAETCNNMASIDLKMGEYEAARESFEKAMKIVQKIGDRLGEATILSNLAMIDLNKGEYEAARENLEKAMKIRQQIGDRLGEAATWNSLAVIDMNKGKYEVARQSFEKAMKIRQRIGDKAGEAETWHNLAMIDLNKGEYEAARENFEKSMKIRQQIGDRLGEASTWHALASINLGNEEYEMAWENYGNAMKIRQQIGDRSGEARTFNQLGVLAWKQGQSKEGLRLVALGYIIISSIGHADAKKAFENLSDMASELSYTQEQFDALQKEVADAYQKDRGQSLIDAAFPKGRS